MNPTGGGFWKDYAVPRCDPEAIWNSSCNAESNSKTLSFSLKSQRSLKKIEDWQIVPSGNKPGRLFGDDPPGGIYIIKRQNPDQVPIMSVQANFCWRAATKKLAKRLQLLYQSWKSVSKTDLTYEVVCPPKWSKLFREKRELKPVT